MPVKTQKTYEQLLKEYRRLAKRADQRMVRLEGYRHDAGMSNILSYAYATAQKAIRHWSGDKAMRFNTAPPKTEQGLIQKIADINAFLNAPTSTKKGILDVYKKRAEAVNRTFYGTDKKKYLSWQEWANFWDKVDADMVDKIPYNEAAAGAGLLKKYNITTTNPEEIRKIAEQLQRTDDIDVIEETIVKFLADNNLTYDKLIKK